MVSDTLCLARFAGGMTSSKFRTPLVAGPLNGLDGLRFLIDSRAADLDSLIFDTRGGNGFRGHCVSPCNANTLVHTVTCLNQEPSGCPVFFWQVEATKAWKLILPQAP